MSFSDKEYREILEQLQQHYPSCFKVDEIIPLALRINNQIFAINSKYSKVKIRRFLGMDQDQQNIARI
ncbi:MAG: ProQ/FinO family protein [Proteobacteria bacterium]|nr:ProQ/FinO family protein [Pseudomonadota bacterium]